MSSGKNVIRTYKTYISLFYNYKKKLHSVSKVKINQSKKMLDI